MGKVSSNVFRMSYQDLEVCHVIGVGCFFSNDLVAMASLIRSSHPCYHRRHQHHQHQHQHHQHVLQAGGFNPFKKYAHSLKLDHFP